MKKFAVLLLLLVTWYMLHDASGGWRRRRRIRRISVGRVICRLSCKWICKKACPICAPVCSHPCKKICGKKRDITPHSPLPCEFSLWDSDRNNSVDFGEFSALVKAIARGKDIRLAFESTDNDGNSVLSRDELAGATFMRGQC
ncbi:uncharacterized protein LOC125662581 [Ostrea edulis]|uniref:uncharacterized protein LOC125662581 n=1 Tax=Ostrea edulis TaxID=37623 RepID=UPI0024AEC985|nr:uncharacterized protein LOC125662581 [Ostrea edulis]